jgi:Uma2 family endonuclease
VSKVKRTAWTPADYERAARKYFRSLPLEHFMEALPQSNQRKITLESLDVLTARRPEVQVFSELLVQYFFQGKLWQVVPDNMVRLCPQPPKTRGSFNVELEPVGPLLVLEYVSPETMRKDYKDSFAKYERELKVPYCLMYYPDGADLRFWQHTGEEYERPTASALGRYAILELELEVGVHDGWVRYWHRGELLPLPGDLLGQLDQERQQRLAAEAEVERLRSLLGQAGQPSQRRPRKGG